MDVNKLEIKLQVEYGLLKVKLLYDGKVISEDSVYVNEIGGEIARFDYE